VSTRSSSRGPARAQSKRFQIGVVGAACLARLHLAVGDRAQVADERERMVAVHDLAPEQRRPRSVPARVLEQQEGVVGRAGGAAEDTGDQVRVVRGELLHRARAVVGQLQEQRPDACGTPASVRATKSLRKAPGSGGREAGDVGVEDLEEVAQPGALGFRSESR
jgi:hypothetical protein